MHELGGGCSSASAAASQVAELRRRARVARDLHRRLDTIVRGLPGRGDVEGWSGPASEAFTTELLEQRDRLHREVDRLESVSAQFEGAAAVLERSALLAGAP